MQERKNLVTMEITKTIGETPIGPSVSFLTCIGDFNMIGLSMEPGVKVEICGGSPSDEGGYHYWGHTYEHEGEFVYRNDFTSSKDCDGPLETHVELRCRVDCLDAAINGCGDKIPDWERVSSRQRDYYAEAMVY